MNYYLNKKLYIFFTYVDKYKYIYYKLNNKYKSNIIYY